MSITIINSIDSWLQSASIKCLMGDGVTMGLPHLTNSLGWKLVDAPKPTCPESHPLWFTSKWLSMNFLMLDEKRAVVEAEEEPIHRMLKGQGIKSIKVFQCEHT